MSRVIDLFKKELTSLDLKYKQDGYAHKDHSYFSGLRSVVMETKLDKKDFFPVRRQGQNSKDKYEIINPYEQQHIPGRTQLVLHVTAQRSSIDHSRFSWEGQVLSSVSFWWALEYTNQVGIDTAKASPFDRRSLNFIQPSCTPAQLFQAYHLFAALPALTPATHQDVVAAFDNRPLDKWRLARLCFCAAPPTFNQKIIRSYQMDLQNVPPENQTEFQKLFRRCLLLEAPPKEAKRLETLTALMHRLKFD